MPASPPERVDVIAADKGLRRFLCRTIQAVGCRAVEHCDGRTCDPAGSPDCLVLYLAGSDDPGLALLANSLPAIAVIEPHAGPIAVRAMKAGALDCLCRPIREGALRDALARALRESRKRRRAQQRQAALEARACTLTPRERQVFERVVHGQLNREIAADLGISEKTVKVHRGRMMHKMKAASVVELVCLALALGVLPTQPETAYHLVTAGSGSSTNGLPQASANSLTTTKDL